MKIRRRHRSSRSPHVARRCPVWQVDTISTRRYDHGRLLGHILGYVGQISEEEYEELSESRYLYSDQIGRTGIEAAYERQLRGTAGRQLVEVDAVGNILRTLDNRPPTPGLSAVLTIDIDLQRRVEAILLEHQGRVIVRLGGRA